MSYYSKTNQQYLSYRQRLAAEIDSVYEQVMVMNDLYEAVKGPCGGDTDDINFNVSPVSSTPPPPPPPPPPLVTSGDLYWYSVSSTDWYNLTNWYSNSSHTVAATSIPLSASTVYILGSASPFVYLDNPNWVSPVHIYTNSFTISFSSNLSAVVTSDITGTAFFYGNAVYG